MSFLPQNQNILITASSNANTWTDIGIDTSLINYIDMLYKIQGIDMTYKRFKQMSDNEKTSFIITKQRDLKIDIINNI